MSDTMLIRLDPSLKSQVARLAKQEGKTATQVIRELLKRYVEERDISTFIDHVWDSTGKQMREAGFSVKDVEKAIKDVRRDKNENRP